jgi:hypothetical protein
MEHVTYLLSNCISSEVRSKNMLVIMDISFILDGWSYSWNSRRLSARSSQRFPATATNPAKSGRSHGPTNRTPQSASAGSNGPISSSILRPR